MKSKRKRNRKKLIAAGLGSVALLGGTGYIGRKMYKRSKQAKVVTEYKNRMNKKADSIAALLKEIAIKNEKIN